jgi:prepilin-type N-terminal cleavage/methylation domain-containing protein
MLGVVTNRRCVSRLARGGFTILESIVAIGLLAVLMTITIQMLKLASLHQRVAERRAIELQTVQAVAELAENMHWNELSPTAIGHFRIPEAVQSYLPNEQLHVAMVDENEPAAKRISIEIQHTGAKGQPGGATRLTTWVFPEQSQSTE